MPTLPPPVPILVHTDDDVVVSKLPGEACSLTSDPKGVSLEKRLALQLDLPQVYLVHRLDRVTCGLLVVATHKEAAAWHGEQLKARRWTKLYVARVRVSRGQGGPDATELLGPHKRYLRTRGRKTEIVRSGGKPSFLDVLAMGPCPDRPSDHHVLIRLGTGRRHQIRVMLADLGAPLVGDRLYGGVSGPFYLEAALLAFPRVGDGQLRLVAPPAPLYREPLAKAVADALEAQAADLRPLAAPC